MSGSWHLGKLAGIDVRIHWTFLLLPIWIYFSSLLAGSGLTAATMSVLFVLAIFGCVVLHELGHALAARKFGIATQDITLLPIGGLARLERMPRSPFQEFVIAVAGPAVNVVIAAVVFTSLALVGNVVSSAMPLVFLKQLAWVNVGLVVFNMIPAFPMDGGRVLRSSLAMFLPYGQATQIAATVGQVAAVGFGFLGLLSGNPMLILIAVFIFFAAKGEAWQVNQQDRSGSRRDFQFRTPDDSITYINESTRPALDSHLTAQQAARWIANQPGDEFPVREGNTVIGAVSRAKLLRAIVTGDGHLPITRMLSIRFTNGSPRQFAS